VGSLGLRSQEGPGPTAHRIPSSMCTQASPPCAAQTRTRTALRQDVHRVALGSNRHRIQSRGPSEPQSRVQNQLGSQEEQSRGQKAFVGRPLLEKQSVDFLLHDIELQVCRSRLECGSVQIRKQEGAVEH